MNNEIVENVDIFILEDNSDIAELIVSNLRNYGYNCSVFSTGYQLLTEIKTKHPVLCIVDLGLPDMDGTEIVRTLHEHTRCGIIILTGRVDLVDRVLGLELGADDYITKPFEPREFIARVHSILRRYKNSTTNLTKNSSKRIARFSGWGFDLNLNTLSKEGKEITLSTAEANLLKKMIDAPSRILSRDQLAGNSNEEALDRSIDVRISRLRRKLGDNPQDPKLIKTVYGSGYLLAAVVEWEL